jgi:hypothetical protein
MARSHGNLFADTAEPENSNGPIRQFRLQMEVSVAPLTLAHEMIQGTSQTLWRSREGGEELRPSQ